MKIEISPTARGQLEELVVWWDANRTWRLRGTPYFAFYRVDEGAKIIKVAAVWSAVRGGEPDLG
ncbi:MAG: hypothetical protein HY903_13265 [Deltaproteobacteria bacterium]|nr:hypothetical protein [Deltaproteobacteria bacterium]